MTFIAGSDRLGKSPGSIEKLLNGWNSGPVRTTDSARGPSGREHVVLKFVSSGERDADTTSVTGISGTLARKYASQGNEKGFEQATGVGSNITVNGKTLYQATREGMGIKSDVAESKTTDSSDKFDPELDTIMKYAATHYPEHKKDKLKAFMKFVQRSLMHSKEDDEMLKNEVAQIKQTISMLAQKINALSNKT
jgi:hypothetical protein